MLAKIVVTCYRQSLYLYHIFPITDVPKKYKGPAKLHATNFLKASISSILYLKLSLTLLKVKAALDFRGGFQENSLQTRAFGTTSADTYLPSELGPP